MTAASGVGSLLKLLISPAGLEAAIPLDIRYGLVSAAGAIAFVVAGVWLAPRYREVVAVGLFAIGARVAWIVEGPWSFPESHPRAYQTSWVPLVLTLIGGVIGVLISVVTLGRTRNQRPS